MLSSSYNKSKKSKPKSRELEVAKEENKSDSGNEASVIDRGSRSCLNWEERGLRFRDLGGMKGVVEDLKDTCRGVRGSDAQWVEFCCMDLLVVERPHWLVPIADEVGCPLYEICATQLPLLPEALVLEKGGGRNSQQSPISFATKPSLACLLIFSSSVLNSLFTRTFCASEENIRDLFSKAYRIAPSIVFIDEIDAIASKREKLRTGMEQRIEDNSNVRPGGVLVNGATNRPHAIDSASRRRGCFDQEILIDVPDERATPGFVGVDLESLISKAANLAMKRGPELLMLEKLNLELTVLLYGPGRFGNVLFVPAPGPNEQGLILRALARKMPVDASVDLDAVGKMEACVDFNGADVADMMRKASVPVLEEKYPSVDSDFISEPCRTKMAQIESTVAEISPSVPKRVYCYSHFLFIFKAKLWSNLSFSDPFFGSSLAAAKTILQNLFKVEERLLLILQYSNCV
ncbi:unnamed protein product [Citrullus colocynthis]|uniref:ATPase AAA-type core domain-containing protein n=1 Tax=Citrullus colocynthis TaxID=252529 RepID=A0ABP0XYV0_9ROSI